MYLERAEMAVALHTATRLARPGGSFCFTHFVEPQGEPKVRVRLTLTLALALALTLTLTVTVTLAQPSTTPKP